MRKINKICVINNYNYGRFLSDCLNSVINQTIPFDKVVIVDDGSTDNSTMIIKKFCKNNSNLIPIYKANAGQLSCFNAASVYVDEESQVFFLDSDDAYPKDYLELFMSKLHNDMFDFAYSSSKEFTDNANVALTALSNDQVDILWNKTSAIVRQQGIWIGNATSSISVSGRIYKSLLPYPFPEDWISRADDLFVYGASIIGAKKLFIPSLSFSYRRHTKSDSTNKNYANPTQEERLRRDQNITRMFNHFCTKFHLKRRPDFTEVTTECDKLGADTKLKLKSLEFPFFDWENFKPDTSILISGFDVVDVENYIRLGAARLKINVICNAVVINGKPSLEVTHLSESN
jgi:glycosyltransferase involved in cell wall biosynthesis